MVASLPFTEEERLARTSSSSKLGFGCNNLAESRDSRNQFTKIYIILCNRVASDNNFISTSHPRVNPITDLYIFFQLNEEETWYANWYVLTIRNVPVKQTVCPAMIFCLISAVLCILRKRYDFCFENFARWKERGEASVIGCRPRDNQIPETFHQRSFLPRRSREL